MRYTFCAQDAAPVKASVVERNPEAVPEVDDVNDRIEETTPLTKKGDIDERESEGSVSSDERSEDHEEEELVRGLVRANAQRLRLNTLLLLLGVS